MNRGEIYNDQRVSLVLPVSTGRRHRNRRVAGTVVGVDEVCSGEVRPGVRVRLDQQVNGVDNCYATYGELDPEVVTLS